MRIDVNNSRNAIVSAVAGRRCGRSRLWRANDAGGALTWSTAQAQEAVRGEIGRPLQAARDLIKAQEVFSEALAKLREADAVPNRTANEKFLLEQMRASAALSAGDNGQAIKAIQVSAGIGPLARVAAGAIRRQPGISVLPRERLSRMPLSGRARRCAPTRLTAQCAACRIQSYYLAGDLASALQRSAGGRAGGRESRPHTA